MVRSKPQLFVLTISVMPRRHFCLTHVCLFVNCRSGFEFAKNDPIEINVTLVDGWSVGDVFVMQLGDLGSFPIV